MRKTISLKYVESLGFPIIKNSLKLFEINVDGEFILITSKLGNLGINELQIFFKSVKQQNEFALSSHKCGKRPSKARVRKALKSYVHLINI